MNAISSRGKLRAVSPKAAAPSKPKVLIFGKPGVGKTWAALDFPSVYYIDTEGGADLAHYTAKLEAAGGVYMGPNEGSQDFATIIEQVKLLTTERHDHRTLVIDSISKVFNMAVAGEADRLLRANIKNEFGADRKPAAGYIRALVAALSRLDMNVILIAHQKDEYGVVDGKRDIIGVSFDCDAKLEYDLHLCLHISKAGSSRYSSVRKSRLQGFPEGERFPWSYNDFATRYGKDVIEKPAAPVVLASDEQVTEALRLIDAVKMPEGWLAKCLSAAGVDTVAELDAEKIGKIINAMKERAS